MRPLLFSLSGLTRPTNLMHMNQYIPPSFLAPERPITYFKDPIELLCAFRDAVANHHEHWKRGELTPGISPDAIFIRDDGLQGPRGILRPSKLVGVGNGDRSVSARMINLEFAPITAALRDCHGPISIPAHDYRDDLESFYYILRWLCATQYGHGMARPLAHAESTVGRDSTHTAALKYRLLHRDSPMTQVFGEGVRTLLNSLRDICLDNYNYRFVDIPPQYLIFDPNAPVRPASPFEISMAKYDYAAFLALIDEAIEEETHSWPARHDWLIAQL